MNRWLAVMMFGLIAVVTCAATQKLACPEPAARVQRLGERVDRLEKRLESYSTTPSQLSPKAARKLKAEWEQVEHELGELKRKRRETEHVRAWLSAGQMFGVVLVITGQIAVIRQRGRRNPDQL